jgi:drug/metabolite transporter (DMT)-like permease
MVFNVAKVLSVKTICKNTNPSVLVFYARLVSAILLIIPAYYSGYEVNDTLLFWGATLLAAILTMFASVLYVKSMQAGDLALVSPIQASVPVFMILTTFVLYNEKPGAIEFLLISMIAVSVAYVLLKSAKARNTQSHNSVFLPVLMSFSASALYGVSTVVDRIAISATTNGALLYSACWNSVTVLLLSYYLFNNYKEVILEAKRQYSNISIYILIATFAFVLQQLSVQESIQIENGVTYVKAIVMLHIGLSALAGVTMLKEKVSADLLISNGIALAGGISLITIV